MVATFYYLSTQFLLLYCLATVLFLYSGLASTQTGSNLLSMIGTQVSSLPRQDFCECSQVSQKLGCCTSIKSWSRIVRNRSWWYGKSAGHLTWYILSHASLLSRFHLAFSLEGMTFLLCLLQSMPFIFIWIPTLSFEIFFRRLIKTFEDESYLSESPFPSGLCPLR